MLIFFIHNIYILYIIFSLLYNNSGKIVCVIFIYRLGFSFFLDILFFILIPSFLSVFITTFSFVNMYNCLSFSFVCLYIYIFIYMCIYIMYINTVIVVFVCICITIFYVFSYHKKIIIIYIYIIYYY